MTVDIDALYPLVEGDWRWMVDCPRPEGSHEPRGPADDVFARGRAQFFPDGKVVHCPCGEFGIPAS